MGGVYSIYTQYFPPKPTLTEENVPTQAGRVFIVTGGNNGVGLELMKMLYGTGATVYLAARSKERAEAAIQQITAVQPAPSTPSTIKFLHLDLNDLASVKAAAETFAAQESRLDVLWNNAGPGALAVPATARTAQGLEVFMGTDCVAPLLFSQLLLAKLQAAVHASSSAAVRVVWSSSLLVEMSSPKGGVDFAKIDGELNDGVAQYSQAKAGNWFLAHEWARRYGQGSEAVLSVSQNPGNLKTDAFNGTPGWLMAIVGWTLQPPKSGAYTLLYAGLSPEITMKDNGGYIIPWGRVSRVARKDINHALTPVEEGGAGAGKKLWDWCEDHFRDFL